LSPHANRRSHIPPVAVEARLTHATIVAKEGSLCQAVDL
jgi:hypothetical protein